MDFSVIHDNLGYLLWGTWPDGPLGGAALTLAISLMAGVASAVLGTLLGVALAMSRGVAAGLLAAVLGFFRAIPVIMLIFWTYFLLPMVFGVEIPEITTVVCALALIASAYLAHAVKAGIAAIGPGQWQAGLSLGLTRWQTLRMIVLPQAHDGAVVHQPVDFSDQRHLAGLYRRRWRTDLLGDPGQQPQHGLPDGSVPVRGAGLFRVLPGARSAGQRG